MAIRMLGRSFERSRGWVAGPGGRAVAFWMPSGLEAEGCVVAPLFAAVVFWIESEAKADSRSSPPLDDAQNFMYRSTILV